jgi:hypothetical protein
LGYFSTPTLGLEGYWVAMITGLALQFLVLVYYLYSISWQEEMKKLLYFAKYPQELIHGSGTLWLLSEYRHLSSENLIPILCSRSIGTIDLAPKTLDDEITELDMIEIAWSQGRGGGIARDNTGASDDHTRETDRLLIAEDDDV